MHELLDLLAGQLAAAGQLTEHALPIGPGLLDHFAALLLGHRQLGLRIGSCVAAPSGRLEVGLLALALRVVSGLAEEPGGALFTFCPDRIGALAGGLEDACCFLADQPRSRSHRR